MSLNKFKIRHTVKTLLIIGGDSHDFRSCSEIISTELEHDGIFDHKVCNDLSEGLNMLRKDIKLLILFYCGGKLKVKEEEILTEWVHSGGGFLGIHSAAASFRGSGSYERLLGCRYRGHTDYAAFQLDIKRGLHPALSELKKNKYLLFDEIYLADIIGKVEVLASAKLSGKEIPLVWAAERGRGRIFFIGPGHTPEACRQDAFAGLLRGGSRWVSGLC